AGIHFFETTVFDGTEMVDDATTVSVVAGTAKPLKLTEKQAGVLGSIARDNFLPVTMAYFKATDERTGEHVSDYDVSFRMHENGVQSNVLIRYPDYSMSADLIELT